MAGDWRHRPGLDQLRAVAVLMVLVGHTSPGPWTVVGPVGVTMFFVLSGYLITGLLVAERGQTGSISLGRFYAHRARRLLPALLPALGLAACANYVTGHPILKPAVSALTYTASYASVGVAEEQWASMSHLWSLTVEEHFYMVWPAVVLFVRRRWLVPLCLAGIAVVAVARYHVSFDNGSLAYRGTHLRVDAMLLGAVLAVVPWNPRRWTLVPAVAVLVWFSHDAHATAHVRWGLVPIAVASGVLVTLAVRSNLRVRWLERIGVISYGVYLYHVPVAYLLRSRGLSGPELLLCTALVTWVIAEHSYRWLEAPIRYWRRTSDGTAAERARRVDPGGEQPVSRAAR